MTTISSGQTSTVTSGETVADVTILSGGVEIIATSGIDVGATVSAGGKLSGPGELSGLSSDFGLVSGATLGATSGDYGDLWVSSGGSALSVTLDNGYLEVDLGATATGAIIVGSGDEIAVYGSTSGTQIKSGAFENVLGGGVASGTVVSSGGSAFVAAGAAEHSAKIMDGGVLVLSSGFAASGVTVASGATVSMAAVVSSGQAFKLPASPTVSVATTLDGVTVSSGGTLDLFDVTVLGGGTLSVATGVVGSATVLSGGRLFGPGGVSGAIDDFGNVNGVTLGDPGGAYAGVMLVEAGGLVSNVSVADGSIQLSAGATARGVAVDGTDDQLLVNAGAHATGTVLGAAGSGFGQNDFVLGSAVDTVISGESYEDVFAGGVTRSSIVSSGGVENVYSGGRASALVVSSGGQADISSDGVVDGGASVLSGGLLVLSSGFAASFTTVFSGGGAQMMAVISAGRTFADPPSPLASSTGLDGVTIEAGGVLDLMAVTVSSSATLWIDSGAMVDAATVLAAGKIDGPGELFGYYTSDYGLISRVSIGDVNDGAYVYVEAGGVLSSATLVDGEIEVLAGGSAGGVGVEGDNEVQVDFGGTASGGALRFGGFEDVYGSAIATVIYGATTEQVESGGVAVGITVTGGGVLSAASGGKVVGAQVSARGSFYDDGSATFSGAATNVFGGNLYGTGAVVEDGPGVLLESGVGGAFAGEVVISGGTVELATSRAVGNASIAFAAGADGSATLQVDAADQPASGQTLAGKLVDFSAAGDALDLRGLAWSAGASAFVSGTSTLVVSDGAYTADFRLSGSKAATYEATSDGHGGTLITPVTGQAMALISAMAVFADAGSPSAAETGGAAPSAGTPLIAIGRS